MSTETIIRPDDHVDEPGVLGSAARIQRLLALAVSDARRVEKPEILRLEITLKIEGSTLHVTPPEGLDQLIDALSAVKQCVLKNGGRI